MNPRLEEMEEAAKVRLGSGPWFDSMMEEKVGGSLVKHLGKTPK